LTLHHKGYPIVAAAQKASDEGTPALTPPRHVAIIMDGNGRWAKERGMPRTLGHRQGVEAVRGAVRTAIELQITYLTIFSFSSENWKRPIEEVDDLMGLMKRFIRRDLAELHKAGVCIRIIGERQHVDSELMTLIDEAVDLTRGNDRLTLVIAFNYGSRGEIAKAARRLAEEIAAGKLDPAAINVERMANALDTSGIPDPDLVIRTSGEMRLSNFLLWQTAYSEFVFLDCYWPDFDKAAFVGAIHEFWSRERRFGGLTKRSAG
jgi:undecaprenyl diphosphate synthase